MQRLLLLSLDRTPASELLPGTVEAWIDALWPGRAWYETDAARITETFRRLTTTMRQWPLPADFLATLPARPPSNLAQLPSRVFTEEERQANIARLKDMMAKVGLDTDDVEEVA